MITGISFKTSSGAVGRILFPVVAALLISGCMAGGIIGKGGHMYAPGIIPSATLTRGAPYKIVCYDEKTASEYFQAKEEGRQLPVSESNPGGLPYIYYKNPDEYSGECDQTGESSQFYLFNVFPVTPGLSPDLAMSSAVQRLEGDTMIRIRIWHEMHYYSLLGRVSVLKAKGTVIKFLNQDEQDTAGGKR